jgi:hypothetical protein
MRHGQLKVKEGEKSSKSHNIVPQVDQHVRRHNGCSEMAEDRGSRSRSRSEAYVQILLTIAGVDSTTLAWEHLELVSTASKRIDSLRAQGLQLSPH